MEPLITSNTVALSEIIEFVYASNEMTEKTIVLMKGVAREFYKMWEKYSEDDESLEILKNACLEIKSSDLKKFGAFLFIFYLFVCACLFCNVKETRLKLLAAFKLCVLCVELRLRRGFYDHIASIATFFFEGVNCLWFPFVEGTHVGDGGEGGLLRMII